MYHYVVTLPTSMLYYHELTQLEMLMQQIDRSPPLFSASQIFPFSTSILTNVRSFAKALQKLTLLIIAFLSSADVWSCYNLRIGGDTI